MNIDTNEHACVLPPDRYVVGIILTKDEGQVVLIKKDKPAAIAGKWTGPGGRVEETDPCLRAAITREVREETALKIPMTKWTLWPYAKEVPGFGTIFFLITLVDKKQIWTTKTIEKEKVFIFATDSLPDDILPDTAEIIWHILESR